MKIQWQSSDRISALPEATIEKILSHMPIRDALKTSILSKRWRHCWMGMPKLVFDDKMVELSPKPDDKDLNKYKFVKAISHVLLLHRASILEFSLINLEIFSLIDLIILYLSRSNNIKKLTLKILGTSVYLLPCSFFSLQGLEYLDLSYCYFELPLMSKGFSMLKSLRFCGVWITNSCNKMVLEFLTNCPQLKNFTLINEYGDIELTECELVELFKCLPSVQVLEISHLCIEHLAAGSSMPHKLPYPAVHLRILVLSLCFYELSSVLCIINSSPTLEKIKLEMCNHDRCPHRNLNILVDHPDYSGLKLDHLNELEMTSFHTCGSEIEFVKLILAKSPLLKIARIELDKSVSVDEENEMLRDLLQLPFPRASLAAMFIIERPKR